MAVRQIVYMGDPRLLETAAPISAFDTPELHALVEDLMDTMQAENGAGLAAPQIGVGFRVVVFGYQTNSRYPRAESVPQTVLLNPFIEPCPTTRMMPGKAASVCRACAVSCPAIPRSVIQVLILRATSFNGRRRASTPGWCNTNAITSMVFYILNACRT